MQKMTWKEPIAFKRARARSAPQRYRWFRPFFLLLIVALMLGGAAFHQKPVAGDWTLTVLVALGVGWLMAYGVPWIASRDPNIVVMSERGIGRQVNMAGAVRHEFWPWDEIAHCRLETVELDSRDYRVLAIYSTHDERADFALSDRLDPRELEEWILAHGRTFHEN